MTERQSDAEQLIADLDEAISGPCQIPCDTPEVPGCRCGDLMLRVEAALRAAPPTTKPNGPYTVGEPEDEDGSTTVLDSSGESLTADEIVTLLNALSQPTSKEPK